MRRGWCDDPLRAPARREGSRDCRAAEMRDELASFYLTELHLTLDDEPGLRQRISN